MKRTLITTAAGAFVLSLVGPVGVAHASAPPATRARAEACSTWYSGIDGLHLRTGPGTRYASVGLLYYADAGTKVGASKHWVKLRLKYRSEGGLPTGTTGWVSKRYVTACQPVPMG
ncbi:SH3 domain-containing protein [Streptomyces lydicus]|uniref:SH3 domain-containing protein n=1 Tax=Streptomyces lydicus TaxID=47763 RepID=UPI001012634B